jgi:hypothetical protein
MTTGFQFAHIDWYSQSGAKKRASFSSSHGTQRGRGWSNSEILAEATRKPGNCGHVPSPSPPTICHGSIQEVEDAIEAFVAENKVEVTLKSGLVVSRKARSDSPSMAAGVISFPRDRIAEWPAFRDHAIEQLKERHGDRLRCVLEHLDEAHPHIHYYVVPRPSEAFGVVHDGYAASRAARKQPENKIRAAFQAAMRAFQDWVQSAICAPFALARLGPGRARLSRKAWKADEIDRLEEREKAVVTRETTLDASQVQIDKLLADLKRRESLMEIKAKDANHKHIERTASLAAQQTKAQEQLDRLYAENNKARKDLVDIYMTMTEIQRTVLQARVPEIIEILHSAKKTKLPAIID